MTEIICMAKQSNQEFNALNQSWRIASLILSTYIIPTTLKFYVQSFPSSPLPFVESFCVAQDGVRYWILLSLHPECQNNKMCYPTCFLSLLASLFSNNSLVCKTMLLRNPKQYFTTINIIVAVILFSIWLINIGIILTINKFPKDFNSLKCI